MSRTLVPPPSDSLASGARRRPPPELPSRPGAGRRQGSPRFPWPAVAAGGAVLRYAVLRLAHLASVWIGVSLLAFCLASVAPGDPAEILLQRTTGEPPTREAVELLRTRLGLDAPAPVRYLRWLGDVARGDLGTSFRTGGAVQQELLHRFPATLQLAAGAMLLGLLVAIPLGAWAAVRRNSAVDHASRLLALLGTAVPSFWLAYLLVLLFAVRLQLLPVAGYGGWRHLVLPTATLGVAAAAGITRLVRAALLEELGKDYLRTARAKGLSEWSVVARHALRNALNPVLTMSGVVFGRLLVGAVVVETVFAWPGIGTYLVDAIFDRDYPVIQGFVLFTGTIFLLLSWLVDLGYLWLDPRVREAATREGRDG